LFFGCAGLTTGALGFADLVEQFVDLFSRHLERFLFNLDLGFDNRVVLVVLASAVDVRDQIKALVIPKLLASEGGFRQLHTVELAVFAVGEIN